MECVILIGLPASGKSSFYEERFAATHDHVSKDRMRGAASPTRRQEALVEASLLAGRSVVVDNTNATRESRAPLLALARRHGARTVGYYFETAAADALRRNRAREGRARVPAAAIFTVRKRLEPPEASEGFDHLYLVRLDDAARRFEVSDLA